MSLTGAGQESQPVAGGQPTAAKARPTDAHPLHSRQSFYAASENNCANRLLVSAAAAEWARRRGGRSDGGRRRPRATPIG